MAHSSFRVCVDEPCMQSPPTERTPDRNLVQMERWTAWVIRLTAHASAEAADPSVAARLEGAREDAESLREALAAAASGWLDEQQIAIVHSVYDLWDENHERTERLAAEADPAWHRRWRIRSVGARPERPASPIERVLVDAAV
jgi:hypothetical protein